MIHIRDNADVEAGDRKGPAVMEMMLGKDDTAIQCLHADAVTVSVNTNMDQDYGIAAIGMSVGASGIYASFDVKQLESHIEGLNSALDHLKKIEEKGQQNGRSS